LVGMYVTIIGRAKVDLDAGSVTDDPIKWFYKYASDGTPLFTDDKAKAKRFPSRNDADCQALVDKIKSLKGLEYVEEEIEE
jgi:hypothetical protein